MRRGLLHIERIDFLLVGLRGSFWGEKLATLMDFMSLIDEAKGSKGLALDRKKFRKRLEVC